MREIEFRGLRKDGKGWVYGDLFAGDRIVTTTISDEWLQTYTYHEVVPSTVGEYIGREDSMGVKIYEGDKVKYLGAKGHIIYVEELAMFMIKFYKPAVSSYAFDNVDDYIEVVGNIHEGGEK